MYSIALDCTAVKVAIKCISSYCDDGSLCGCAVEVRRSNNAALDSEIYQWRF